MISVVWLDLLKVFAVVVACEADGCARVSKRFSVWMGDILVWMGTLGEDGFLRFFFEGASFLLADGAARRIVCCSWRGSGIVRCWRSGGRG